MDKYISELIDKGSFLSGSYLIKSDYNDIDVVVPLSVWKEQDLIVEESKYRLDDTTYQGDFSLHSTHRSGQYNLIVVYDQYMPGWRRATNIMVAQPDKYQDKIKRAVMFERVKLQFKYEGA